VSPKIVVSIVDDDEAVRNSLKNLLRSLGYSAHAFESAEAFLTSPQLQQTACLILDVHMPGLNGIELQARLNAEGHRIPIIFVTGVPDDRIRDRAMREGAIAFMSKPISQVNLMLCLDRALKNG
jgi:FixJ family two-component response regulator